MNAPTQALATREESRELTPVERLKRQVHSKRDEFVGSLPAHISFEKFQRTVATAALTNPQLLECDRQSLLVSASKAAQDGLLPDGREAALVPFKVNKKGPGGWQSFWAVQYMPMVYGLRKKILQSGDVVSLETGVVYRAEAEAGHFIYEVGLEPPIRHRPKLDLTDEEMDDSEIVAAYSIARISNAGGGEPFWSVEVMRRAEINKVRETSQTGATRDRKGQPRKASGPWVDWFGEMAKKTVLRRHSKTLPMSGDVLDAIDREDEELAAQGAAHLLDVEPDAPVALPSNDDLDSASERVDEETGEVTDEPATNPATGMTEVDEETARELDARMSPEAEQTLQDIDGPIEQGEGDEASGLNPAAQAILDKIEGMLVNADHLADVRAADAEWQKHRVTYSEPTIKVMDELIHRTASKAPEKKPGRKAQ